MIEINLLPEELKPRTKNTALQIRSRQILYLVVFIFGVLLIAHLYLAGAFIIKNLALGMLNSKWSKLQPQRKLVADFKREYEEFSRGSKIMERLIGQSRGWSQKLNKLSLSLPSGIWFNEITVSPKKFILKASVISLQKEEMNIINIFMDNLKKDKDFFKDFNNLELSSVERQIIGGYDIANFILEGELR